MRTHFPGCEIARQLGTSLILALTIMLIMLSYIMLTYPQLTRFLLVLMRRIGRPSATTISVLETF